MARKSEFVVPVRVTIATDVPSDPPPPAATPAADMAAGAELIARASVEAVADAAVEMADEKLNTAEARRVAELDGMKLIAAARMRAAKFGIPPMIGAARIAPVDAPDIDSAWGDPVNYRFRIDALESASDSRERFREEASEYPSDGARRAVYTRIVAAMLKFGVAARIDPRSKLDSLLPPDLKTRVQGMQQMGDSQPTADEIRPPLYDDSRDSAIDAGPSMPVAAPVVAYNTPETQRLELMRVLHQILAEKRLAETDREFLMGKLNAVMDGKDCTVEDIQRAQGIASSLGVYWPQAYKPLGMPDDRMLAAYSAARGAVAVFRDISGAETYSVPGVEIFGAGTWKGEEWTVKDLEEMARNYRELQTRFTPPLKIGHSNQIAENSFKDDDSMPALGWAVGVRVQGDKLVADFSDVPKVVRDLIHRRAYKRVSAEIYRDFVDGATGKRYGKVLRAVALLGGELPAVKTLRDVLLLYGEAPLGSARSECVTICSDEDDNHGGTKVDPKELEQMRQQIADSQTRFAAIDAENLRLKSQLRAEARKSRDAEARMFCEKLKADGILTPAVEPLAVTAMIAVSRAEAEADAATLQTFGEATQGAGLTQVLKSLLGALPKAVIFGESMPSPTPTPAAAPGAPTQSTPAPAPRQAPAVQTYSDGLGRSYPVQGGDEMAAAREYMAKHPGVSLTDTLITIQKSRSGAVAL